MMNIPRTSIRKIIAEDLKLQPFKKIKGQRIDTRTKEKRIEQCPNLLSGFTKQVLKTAFFSDEKIFKVTQLLSVQNDRTYLRVPTRSLQYYRKQTLVRGTQWFSYEPHGICCHIKTWQIIHFLY